MNTKNKVVPSGQHYSGSNRIPNVQQFIESLDRDKKQRDAQLDEQMRAKAAAAKAAGKNGGAVPHKEAAKGKNRRVVTDPVTGKDIEIDDMDASLLDAAQNPKLSVPNANLGKPTPVRTDASQSGEAYRRNQDVTAPPDPVAPGSTSDVPIHGEKTNVLFHPTPAVSYEPMFAALEARANGLAAAVFAAIVVVGGALGARLLGLVVLAAGVASAVFLWAKDVIRQGRANEWASEQRRGETAVVNLIPESVEWLNAALGLVWGLINPELFASVADTLEDVMQASVPGVVENVKVNDINQGANPLRVLSLRALPDSMVADLKDQNKEEGEDGDGGDPEAVAAADAADAAAEHYNLEATVAYHALPSGRDVSSKARNMGMQLVFYLGVRGLFGLPFPVWVELHSLVATVRLRVALTPDPPFVSTVRFTLMGQPRVEAGCVPLVRRGANVLNLPVIATFVNWAIAATAAMYVAPKSMTLDVGALLAGDSVQKDTAALGVLFVRIHRATGLSKQDRRGSAGGGSDPYVCVAFSKFGKPQYCTRVIQDDLNPIFEETAALLVTADVVKADEQLALELWDSDRASADDVVGRVELSIQKLLQHPGRLFPQVSRLRGIHADRAMPGELHWEVGFFGKTRFRAALRTDGKDPRIPAALRDAPALQDDRGVVDSADDDAVVHTPPDPLWPSGVLSIVVHQIVGLELQNVQGSRGGRRPPGREFEPARPEAGELRQEQDRALPSAYCTIILNDELVYKTRTKVVSSKPIFEAGTERFVRDWRSAIVTVTVRDARHREHDPILGVVPLKLSDVLLASSQSTRWYPLDGGIGYGRVRISLLFRAVELTLPPSHVGFGEVGTFEFLSDSLTAVGWAPSSHVKIRLRTGGSSASIHADRCSRTADGDGGLQWDLRGTGHHAGDGEAAAAAAPANGGRIRLPVQYRYRSPVFFALTPHGRSKKKHAVYASVWLQDLVDNAETDFDLPLWRCDNPLRLSQNYITEANCRDVPDLALTEVGRLRFRGRFQPGTDRDHLRFVSDNDARETIESWEACFAEGVRAESVRAEVPPAVQELHERSLLQGRDVLAQASPEDKKRWLAKDGTDWTGAFGADPADLVAEAEAEARREGRSVALADTAGGDDAGTGSDSDADADDDSDSDSDSDEPDLGIRDAEHGEPPSPPGVAAAARSRPSADTGRSKTTAGTAGTAGAATTSSTTTTGTGTSGSSGASGASAASANAGANGSNNPVKQYKDYKSRSRDLHRRHRGLMQWKPMRNIQFAKDEATFAVRRVLNVGKLSGRTPDVETEVA